MRDALAAKDLDIEPAAVPHAHREDEQQEHAAPERAVVQHEHRRQLREYAVHYIRAHIKMSQSIRDLCYKPFMMDIRT